MKKILLIVAVFSICLFVGAQNVLVGWHTFDAQTTSIAAEVPDYIKSGFSAVLGNSISGTSSGGGKGTKQDAHSTDNTYGGTLAINPVPTAVSSVVLNTWSGNNNSRLDIQITNNTGADVALSSVHVDYKLNSGTPEEATIRVAHLSGFSDLDDAFAGRNITGTLTATDYAFHSLNADLSGMADVTLADGEKAAFRIEVGKTATTGVAFFIDNIAIADNSPTTINKAHLYRQVKLYPNPSSDIINIDAVGIDIAEVELLDLTGKVVYQSNTMAPIHVSDFPKGLYVLMLEIANGDTSTHKVMVK